MNKLPIVAVCYGNEKEVAEFIGNISKQKDCANLSVLITCNKVSDKDFLERLADDSEVDVRFFYPDHNMGYLNGCLYGLREYTKEHDFDYAFISNTDVSFADDSFFDRFIANKYDEKYSVIGPDIVEKNGTVHKNPYMMKKPSKGKINSYCFFYSNRFLFKIFMLMHNIKKKKNERNPLPSFKKDSCECFSVFGCSFFITKDFYEKSEMISEELFLYAEEIAIGNLVAKNGGKCFYDSSLSMNHVHGQSTGKVNTDRRRKFFYRSMKYIRKMFY